MVTDADESRRVLIMASVTQTDTFSAAKKCVQSGGDQCFLGIFPWKKGFNELASAPASKDACTDTRCLYFARECNNDNRIGRIFTTSTIRLMKSSQSQGSSASCARRPSPSLTTLSRAHSL